MNNSDIKIKPRLIKVDFIKVDWYQFALDTFKPIVHPTLMYQVRKEHVSCAFAHKCIAMRSQSNLEKRAFWALNFEILTVTIQSHRELPLDHRAELLLVEQMLASILVSTV